MRLTTLCYIQRENSYLMMHRIKKHQDENAGKWIGIGGHMEENESPEECILREAGEETGLSLRALRLRGVITFILPDWGNELTFLYTAETDGTEPPPCFHGCGQLRACREMYTLCAERAPNPGFLPKNGEMSRKVLKYLLLFV